MREKAKELPGNLVKQLVSWSLIAGGGGVESKAAQLDDLHPSSMARRHASTAVFRSVMRDERYFCISCVGLPKCEKLR